MGDGAALAHVLHLPEDARREDDHDARTPAGVARHLVVRGAADAVVPLEHRVPLHARAAAPRDLLVLEGADHR